MKNKYIKQMLIIPMIIWMIIVFGFSNEPADESKNTSSRVAKIIVEIVMPKETSFEEKQQLIEEMTPTVRKIAHFILYAIGGFLIILYINIYKIDKMKKMIYSILIGVIYAGTDEIHQTFIPGRSGQISDVVIDFFGVVTGVCFCIIITKTFRRIINKKNIC